MKIGMFCNYSDLLGDKGPIANVLDRFEYRQVQVDMANAIASAVEGEEHLLVEAGTGVGKSFAYLIPFIKWCVDENKKVVISTYTKALQEQLARKDLPFLEKTLGLDFKYALCFGGENYLCKRRLTRSWQQGLFETKREAAELEKIMEWASETQTGLRMELDFEPQDKVWFRICRESDLCRGKRCRHREECFYAEARTVQSQAHLLIVNHHLFFSDIASGRQILPSYHAVVFDEAHNIEEVAADHLGFELSNTQLNYMLDEFHHPRYKTGFLQRMKELKQDSELKVLLNAARQAGDIFFNSVLNQLQGRATLSLHEPNLLENNLSSTLEQIVESVGEKIEKIKDEEDKDELAVHVLRLKGWASFLNEFIGQQREGHVYWAEAMTRPRHVKCQLCASPVDVAPYLRKLVFDEIAPIIFTSATITVNNSFDFLRERLGIETPKEIALDSPFEFETKTLLYTAKDLPDPARQQDLYVEAISKRIDELVKITKGRTFILFTSYQTLGQVYENLEGKLSDYEILRQGELPRWQLLNKFKKKGDAILFGTSTFWQGVDVPGSALENVIITRLPFAVPDHPLVQARILNLESKGQDAFMNYQVPRAVLLFKQGFGRLIRHRDDLGIVAILDPRIRTRHYGKAFLKSLPQCKEIDDLDRLALEYQALKDSVT